MGEKCRTPLCWTELSEKKVIGPDLIQETEENVKMIREILKIANDRQKSYADMKRKDIRYEIGEKVFLKVSPWKKVMRFGKNGKLSPRFIGRTGNLSPASRASPTNPKLGPDWSLI